MKIYHYRPDFDHYNGIKFRGESDRCVLEIRKRNTPVGESWQPIVAHGLDENPGEEGDFPCLSNYGEIPVFSDRALELLTPVLGDFEALPMIHPSSATFFIINVLEIVDCFDLGRSTVKKFSDGRIMRVVEYCLLDERVVGKHIFKAPVGHTFELIVDDCFRHAVESHGLRGLRFDEELPLVQTLTVD